MFTVWVCLILLLLKMSGPLGPRTCSLMQKGAVFHFTLHCCNTVLMTILFIIQCLLYEFVSYFSLFLPLKMSGPLGPHTYIQMQKGAVFHFTLHSMFTVWVCLILLLFTLFTFINVRSTGPTYLCQMWIDQIEFGQIRLNRPIKVT